MNTTTTNQIMTNNKGGVKTTEGKEISKYNAIRHGILVRVMLEDEQDEAKTIQSRLLEEYQPQTLTEELLIETMVISYMRRQRACFQEINGMRAILYFHFFRRRNIPTIYNNVRATILPSLTRASTDTSYTKWI